MSKILTCDAVMGLQTLESESIDLTVTSPPYDNLRQYHGISLDMDGVTRELYRVTKKGGVVVWVVGDAVINGGESGNSFRQALKFMDAGFLLNDTMIYKKTGTTFSETGKRYTQIFEYMFVFSKGIPKTFNPIKDVPKLWEGSWGKGTQRQKDGTLKDNNNPTCGAARSGRDDTGKYGWKQRYNIWEYKSGGKFKHPDWEIAKKHPATFPYKLAEDHILSWSNIGDVVLDPFCGSGTVGLAATINNREYILMDISEVYTTIAKERINKPMQRKII